MLQTVTLRRHFTRLTSAIHRVNNLLLPRRGPAAAAVGAWRGVHVHGLPHAAGGCSQLARPHGHVSDPDADAAGRLGATGHPRLGHAARNRCTLSEMCVRHLCWQITCSQMFTLTLKYHSGRYCMSSLCCSF